MTTDPGDIAVPTDGGGSPAAPAAPADPGSPLLADGIEPVLTDGAVLLRRFTDADVDQLTAACQDPEVQRFIPVPRPYGRSDAVDYVARTRSQWADGSKAAFVIVEPADPSHLAGAINIAVSGSTGNSGYWVAAGARRRGVACRSLRLLTEWAFETLGLGVIVLEIRPENEASIAVAARAGYHEAGRLDVRAQGGKKGALLFARLASDASG